MSRFRYHGDEQWFKGNLHIHSTASDGGAGFAELADMYAREGYDFLCRTDHWVSSDVSADASEYPLLWLDGNELNGADVTGENHHVVCIGRFTNIEREMGFVSAMDSVREQGGILILAHPHWTGNTTAATLRGAFDGVEVYNHVCRWLNGKSDGWVHWDVLLNANPQALGVAVDDAHVRPEHPGWNGGWVMVRAAECSREAIMDGIRRGRFYSSCGPEIHDLRFDNGRLAAETSEVRFARLVGPQWQGARLGSFEGKTMTSFEFDLPTDWRYVYLEVEDIQGRRAWTNHLFGNP